jgi:hypothetical protein
MIGLIIWKNIHEMTFDPAPMLEILLYPFTISPALKEIEVRKEKRIYRSLSIISRGIIINAEIKLLKISPFRWSDCPDQYKRDHDKVCTGQHIVSRQPCRNIDSKRDHNSR